MKRKVFVMEKFLRKNFAEMNATQNTEMFLYKIRIRAQASVVTVK